MAYPISAGIEISPDGTNWYKLTDHNREPISANPELIEAANRMANGKMRKYVVAKKMKFSVDWTYIPTKTSLTVDGHKSSAWLDAFYQAYAGLPVHIKIINSDIDFVPIPGNVPSDSSFRTSQQNSTTYTVFITAYSSTVLHRTVESDYAKMNIEFTEI